MCGTRAAGDDVLFDGVLGIDMDVGSPFFARRNQLVMLPSPICSMLSSRSLSLLDSGKWSRAWVIGFAVYGV